MELFGVSLITEDVARLAAFYEAILQATAEGDAVHTEIRVPGGSLTLYSKEAAVRDMGFTFGPEMGWGHTTLLFRVDDVDGEFRRLERLGIEFLTKPTTYPWGARAFHFRDPDGNIVDFVRPPQR